MQTVIEGVTGLGSMEGMAARVKRMCAERCMCTGRERTYQDLHLLWIKAKPRSSLLGPGKQT